MTETRSIVTHNGPYHADDVVAVALLQCLPDWRHAPLVRTRDEEVIRTAAMVVDVGGEYAPERGKFDHHFDGSPQRGDGNLYAAAGLILRHFFKDSPHGQEEFVLRVDVADTTPKNSRSDWRFSRLVHKTNPLPGSPPAAYDQRFLQVVEIVRLHLLPTLQGDGTLDTLVEVAEHAFESHWQVQNWVAENEAVQAASAERIRAAFKRALEEGSPLVRLEGAEVALYSTLGEAPQGLLYTVFPHVDGTYMVQQIPTEREGFVGRKPLPEIWAGKKGLELQKLSGVSDAVFCHPGRFICGAQTVQGALEMAEIAISM